ncbi:MAG: hypothetical protein C4322_22220, partial [Mastigocladus sp. ERB_26_1]
MQKLWKSLLVSPAILGAILLVDATALAGETINTSENTQPQLVVTPKQKVENKNTQSQVTSVSQLSDVQPTDWAFQALQSLVERYGCIAGYPNGTYRGNRPMTR